MGAWTLVLSWAAVLIVYFIPYEVRGPWLLPIVIMVALALCLLSYLVNHRADIRRRLRKY